MIVDATGVVRRSVEASWRGMR